MPNWLHKLWEYVIFSERLGVDTTTVGNVGAGEDDLASIALAANAVRFDGQYLIVRGFGTFANNANAKTLKLYLDSTAILTHSLPTSTAGSWVLEAQIVRTGAATEAVVSQLLVVVTAGTATHDLEVSAPTEDFTTALTIKCTGEATSDNDIVQNSLTIELRK